MKNDRGALLFLARSGMEMSWRYAWATFLTTSIARHPFPLPEAIGTSLLAAALHRALRGGGLRVIAVGGIYILGFLLAASRIVYTFNYRAFSYFDKGWVLEFFSKTRDPLQWLTLVILLILAFFFWRAGAILAGRSTAYLSICIRFDYGVAAFFCLFIVKSLMLVKGGIEVRDAAPVLLLFPFFIFGLSAIGLARNRSSERREFLAGYRGVGVLLSFAVVVLAFGAGLVLFCMSYLSAAAEVGYGVLKSAAAPLAPVLVSVLRFLFLGHRMRQEPAAPPAGAHEMGGIPSGPISWWGELIHKILGWGLLGLGLLLAVVLLALGMWYLLRWLFSRTSKAERNRIDWRRVLWWAQRLWAALDAGLKRALQRLKGYRDADQLYRAFLKWGRRSGLPHLLSETPAEYGSRLKKRFPSLAGEIEGIVEAFNLAVYGEIMLDDARMTLAHLSWRKLCSPRCWPARLKSWFFRGKG
jgi:hypothetical protein